MNASAIVSLATQAEVAVLASTAFTCVPLTRGRIPVPKQGGHARLTAQRCPAVLARRESQAAEAGVARVRGAATGDEEPSAANAANTADKESAASEAKLATIAFQECTTGLSRHAPVATETNNARVRCLARIASRASIAA